jgi:hypothetical protein
MNDQLTELSGTSWKGKGELWLDPAGNSAEVYGCEMSIRKESISYCWTYDNEIKQGKFIFSTSGVTWVDSWHQETAVQCSVMPQSWGIFTLYHEYQVPGNAAWAWRTTLSARPDGSLVLQMTNIAPWGEEGRAVRMVFTRQQA